MGRAILKSLKESTLLTFFSICHDWNLKKDEHYTFNSTDGIIKWYNGSEVYLKDLFAEPSDPEFDSLGSTEYTGAFIDEASQITNKAKNIVMSRLRYKLEEFNTIPKLLITSNPSKNFLYMEFYKPYKAGTMLKFRKFIPALVYDNPYISPHYIENLKKLDKISKERLLYGNFEYDDDPAKMIDYDKILEIFQNKKVSLEGRYITVDPARFGQDKTVIMIWEGLYMKKVYAYPYTKTTFVEAKIKQFAAAEDIPWSNIVSDDDGVGGGIVDHLPGIHGFVNNASPIPQKYDTNNYQHLKAQCYQKLATYINSRKIGVNIENNEYKEFLVEELEQVKRKNIDKDAKFQIIGKDEVKENIGRSPDFSDCMMQRLFFELAPTGEMEFLSDPDNLIGLS